MNGIKRTIWFAIGTFAIVASIIYDFRFLTQQEFWLVVLFMVGIPLLNLTFQKIFRVRIPAKCFTVRNDKVDQVFRYGACLWRFSDKTKDILSRLKNYKLTVYTSTVNYCGLTLTLSLTRKEDPDAVLEFEKIVSSEKYLVNLRGVNQLADYLLYEFIITHRDLMTELGNPCNKIHQDLYRSRLANFIAMFFPHKVLAVNANSRFSGTFQACSCFTIHSN